MIVLSKPTEAAATVGRSSELLSSLPAARRLSLQRRAPQMILLGALANWVFQVGWFWRYLGKNIDADGVSYIGIARHVADGNFIASLHGYWSPFISWVMSALFLFSSDYIPASRALMLVLFATSLALTFVLTKRLWGASTLSAVAVLWFTLARGVAVFSLFIGADLLVTAAVLAYFTLLLKCLERPQGSSWLGLGAVHAIAFLAKAIALPLLGFTTVLALVFSGSRSTGKRLRNFVLALILPVVAWVGWGGLLKQKYGVFNAGYQLRFNLIDPALRGAREAGDQLNVLRTTDQSYDEYMVSDAMPPGSRLWKVPIVRKALIGKVLSSERKNIPQACKELLVLLTPGGVAAVIACLWFLGKRRAANRERFEFAVIVLLATVALIMAYGMLVFDGRYVIPIAPVLIALAMGAFASLPGNHNHDSSSVKRVRLALAGLIAIGLMASQFYWASPFRVLRQDYQSSVYRAGEILKAAGARRVIAAGEGPYPEHGVGWEAGMYAAYFSGSRIVAALFAPLAGANSDAVAADISRVPADAVMLWGSPGGPAYSHPAYSELKAKLHADHPNWLLVPVRDVNAGEVGSIFFVRSSSPHP